MYLSITPQYQINLVSFRVCNMTIMFSKQDVRALRYILSNNWCLRLVRQQDANFKANFFV